ncbi:MAG: ABC transporter permease [Chloroflexi bacterium]|nr:ABC transporter permease [Chloroflexota bacterium]
MSTTARGLEATKRPGLSVPAGPGWLVLPSGLLLLLFFALPLGATLAISFYRTQPGVLYVPDFNLDNYGELFRNQIYINVMIRTLRISALVTLFALILGYPVAMAMARGPQWLRGILLISVLLPLLVSVVVRTYGWMIVLGTDGPVNQFLQFVGITSSPTKLVFNETGVMIGLVHVYFPFMVLPLSSVIQKIDRNLEDAASSLGANRLTIFRRVILPLSIPGIAAGSMLVFTLSSAAFVTPALLGGTNLNMMATLVAQQIQVLVNWPLGAAVAVMLIVITLVVVGLYNHFLESRGGVYRGVQ